MPYDMSVINPRGGLFTTVVGESPDNSILTTTLTTTIDVNDSTDAKSESSAGIADDSDFASVDYNFLSDVNDVNVHAIFLGDILDLSNTGFDNLKPKYDPTGSFSSVIDGVATTETSPVVSKPTVANISFDSPYASSMRLTRIVSFQVYGEISPR